MNYTFAKHEKFYIRSGWLKKGLNALEDYPHIFLETINAMDELGIGKNMIMSLRYWMQATNLTTEKYKGGEKIQEKTDFADLILKYDPFFEDKSTFWLLHYKLSQEKKLATTWYWFFNHFNYVEFDQELFIDRLTDYIKRTGENPPSISSLESDYDVLRKMYISNEDKFDLKQTKYDPEKELMKSPFSELNLLINSEDNSLKINRPNMQSLPVEILFYCILDNFDNADRINIDSLNSSGSVSSIFKLNVNLLFSYLEKMQEKGYIRIDKQAGLNSITIYEKSKEDILSNYYEKH